MLLDFARLSHLKIIFAFFAIHSPFSRQPIQATASEKEVNYYPFLRINPMYRIFSCCALAAIAAIALSSTSSSVMAQSGFRSAAPSFSTPTRVFRQPVQRSFSTGSATRTFSQPVQTGSATRTFSQPVQTGSATRTYSRPVYSTPVQQGSTTRTYSAPVYSTPTYSAPVYSTPTRSFSTPSFGGSGSR